MLNVLMQQIDQEIQQMSRGYKVDRNAVDMYIDATLITRSIIATFL